MSLWDVYYPNRAKNRTCPSGCKHSWSEHTDEGCYFCDDCEGWT